MIRWLVRRFVAWRIDKEADKFERLSEPWNACVLLSRIFRDTYRYK